MLDSEVGEKTVALIVVSDLRWDDGPSSPPGIGIEREGKIVAARAEKKCEVGRRNSRYETNCSSALLCSSG